jgi:hypothetical protein
MLSVAIIDLLVQKPVVKPLGDDVQILRELRALVLIVLPLKRLLERSVAQSDHVL